MLLSLHKRGLNNYLHLLSSNEQDCAVIIDASTANQYSDDSWGAVALTVGDYNREDIQLGVQPLQPLTFQLTSTAVQVSILKTI